MLDTLRSVLRFRRFEWTPPSVGWPPWRTPTTCGGSPSVASLPVCSTTSTGAPRTSGRCAPTAPPTPGTGSARGCYATCRPSTPLPRCWVESWPCPWCWLRPGFTRIADPQGELAVARAAQRAGVPYTLSTLSTRSIEEVADANADGRRWFQVYVWKDRGLLRDMIDRAAAAGYEALVITVDTANLGRRERDVRRGFELPRSSASARSSMEPCTRRGRGASPVPSRSASPTSASSLAASDQPEGSSAVNLAETFATQFDARLSWDDVEWFRSAWHGPIVIKGIQTVDDALRAAEAGVEAIALSNHGGRQLDDAPAALDLVAPVADEVGGRVEIICDGGVRRGSDIVKAIALGATACMAGRAYLYGLAAGGELGVETVLDLLAADVRRTMALLGVARVERALARLPRTRALTAGDDPSRHARRTALCSPVPPVRARPGEAAAGRGRQRPRPAADRQARRLPAGCSTTSTGVPRTNWRCRPIADAFAATSSGRGSSATCRRSTRRRRCSGRRSVAARARADRASPGSSTRPVSSPSPERAARRRAVHVVDDGDAIDRGGRRRQWRRSALVPGLRLARPRPGQGHDRASAADGYDSAGAHRGHRRARTPRARRPAWLRDAPKLGLDTIVDGLFHPGWTWRFARSEPIRFANIATRSSGSTSR